MPRHLSPDPKSGWFRWSLALISGRVPLPPSVFFLNKSLYLASFFFLLHLLSNSYLLHNNSLSNRLIPLSHSYKQSIAEEQSTTPSRWPQNVCIICRHIQIDSKLTSNCRANPHNGYRPPEDQPPCPPCRNERCSRPQARRSRHQCRRTRRHRRSWIHTRHAPRANRRAQVLPYRQERTIRC
jgi:hypothetical protein